MPRHRTHRAIDKAVLGRSHRDVHTYIDKPYKTLGRKHRELRHDPYTLVIKFCCGEKMMSALLHLLADMGRFEYRGKKAR